MKHIENVSYILLGLIIVVFGFQNCGQVSFSDAEGQLVATVDDGLNDAANGDQNRNNDGELDTDNTTTTNNDDTTAEDNSTSTGDDNTSTDDSSDSTDDGSDSTNDGSNNTDDGSDSSDEDDSTPGNKDNNNSSDDTSDNNNSDDESNDTTTDVDDGHEPQSVTTNNSNQRVTCYLMTKNPNSASAYVSFENKANGQRKRACMSVEACLSIASQHFNVNPAKTIKMAEGGNGTCKQKSNNQNQRLSDNEVAILIQSLMNN